VHNEEHSANNEIDMQAVPYLADERSSRKHVSNWSEAKSRLSEQKARLAPSRNPPK